MTHSLSSFQFQDSVPAIHFAAIAEVPAGITEKQRLLDELCLRLQFPDYFGDNWDALEECIRDLSWLPRGLVALSHKDVPLIKDPPNLAIYLSILGEAVDHWSSSSERRLVVVFPPNAHKTLTFILEQESSREQ